MSDGTTDFYQAQKGEAMSRKDLLLEPHQLGDCWWYETMKGVELCVPRAAYDSAPDESGPYGVIVVIPWDLIKKALERKERP